MTQPPQAPDEFNSRSLRKREAHAREALASILAELNPVQRGQLPLPEHLAHAVTELDRVREHGARKRQLKYVGRLLRELDEAAFEAIQAQLDAIRQDRNRAAAAFHALERWRERLLQEGQPALDAWCARYPATDRALLMQRLAEVKAAQGATTPDPAPARQLFRDLRSWMDAGTA